MKFSENDRLLRDILADENVERLREASLARMLEVTRRRRRRRTWMSGAAASLAIMTTLLVMLRRETSAPIVEPPEPIGGRVKIINDEQLLALFPDRSVALIGRPGDQRLLFLDGEQPSANGVRPQ